MSILNNVKVKTGSQGPSQDPYSYIEITWTENGKVVILHQGLANWCKVDGKEFEGVGNTYESYPVEVFEKETGLKVEDIYDALYKDESVECPQCKSEDIEWVDGMPGESLLKCKNCDTVIDSSFDESAII